MTWVGLIEVTHNAALLLAFAYIYDQAQRYWLVKETTANRITIGVALGILNIMLMLTPWQVSDNFSVDARTVLLSVSGLFFGIVPTLITVVFAVVLILYQGGPFAPASVIVIIAAALFGLLWRYWRRDVLSSLSILHLYIGGFVIHGILFGGMHLLAGSLPALNHFSLFIAMLFVFPVVTALIGGMFVSRLRLVEASRDLRERELLYSAQFKLGYIGIVVYHPEGDLLKGNPRLFEMLGISERNLKWEDWKKICHPEDLPVCAAKLQSMSAGEIDTFEINMRFFHSSGRLVYAHLAAACSRVNNVFDMLAISLFDRNEEEQRAAELRASQEQLSFVLEGSNLGYWDWHIESGKIERNDEWALMLGYDPEEIKNTVRQWLEFIHPDDRERAWQSITDHLSGKSTQHKVEYRMLMAGGGIKWVLDSATIVSYDDNGKPLRMCGTHTDIDDRKAAEQSMQMASVVYQNSSEAMSVTDAQGYVITMNPAYCAMTGYDEVDIIGHRLPFFHDPLLAAQHLEHGKWQGEVRERRKNGEEYVAWLTLNTIYHDDGSVAQRVALFSDITQRKQSEEIIWRQANFDPLTGLPNRRMLMDYLDQEIKKSQRYKTSLVVFFLDLDSFKEVNDTLGHDKGDLLLKEAASRLSQCVRASDIVARLGGDEFTVLLTEIEDASIIERIARHILRRLSEPFQLQMDAAYVSVSIGITVYPTDADSAEELLKNADQAMYAAKDQGRNRFNYFTPLMQREAKVRMELANDLRAAIASESQLQVYYQPIMDLNSLQMVKAEALLRWKHPAKGFVTPVNFIPIAEDTGLISELGFWTFKQACLDTAQWRDQFGMSVPISVNKSPVQFRDERNSLQRWFDFMELLGLTGSDVVIEITEGLLLDASDVVKNKLLEFRDAGIQVAIDDFGTGYSSLAYLRKFDIDYLKIDKSFVANITSSKDDYALCEAIIVMAHKLGVKVIAEGVESEAQLQLLQAAQCDFAQGYWFAKPMPADEFSANFLFSGPVLEE